MFELLPPALCSPIDPPSITLTPPDDGFLNLIDNDGAAKDDVKLPDGDLGEQIQAAFEEGKELNVTIVSAMGEEHCLAFKDVTK